MCRKICMVCVMTMGLFAVQFSGLGDASQIGEKELFKGLKTETIWEKEFDGKIRDIKVGGENIVVVTDKDDLDIVSYLNSDGSVLWEKKFKLKRDEYGEYLGGFVQNISISEDGEYVIVNCGLPWERVDAKSYDSKGSLKWETNWETDVLEPGLTLSPKGSYAITTRQSGEEMMGRFRIFDNKTGKELWKDTEKETFVDENGRTVGQINWTATWLDDSTVAWVKGSPAGSFSCRHPYCKVILFDVKRLQPRWEVDIGKELGDPEHYGISWYTPVIEVSNNGEFIAVAADYYADGKKRVEKRTLVVLSNKGNLLWYNDDFVTIKMPSGEHLGGLFSFSFNAYSKNLIVISQQPTTIDVFDALTGEKKWRQNLGGTWAWEKSRSFVVADNLVIVGGQQFDEMLLLDWNTGAPSTKPADAEGIVPVRGYNNDKINSLILLDVDKKQIKKVGLKSAHK